MIYGIWNFGSAPFNGSAFGGVPFGAMPARDLICLSAASKYTGIFDQPVTYPTGAHAARICTAASADASDRVRRKPHDSAVADGTDGSEQQTE